VAMAQGRSHQEQHYPSLNIPPNLPDHKIPLSKNLLQQN